MDYMLFASIIESIIWQKFIISSLNNENQITFLRGDSKYVVTGIPLHESGLPQEFPRRKILAIDPMC